LITHPNLPQTFPEGIPMGKAFGFIFQHSPSSGWGNFGTGSDKMRNNKSVKCRISLSLIDKKHGTVYLLCNNNFIPEISQLFIKLQAQ
jgi:hypothetical protein